MSQNILFNRNESYEDKSCSERNGNEPDVRKGTSLDRFLRKPSSAEDKPTENDCDHRQPFAQDIYTKEYQSTKQGTGAKFISKDERIHSMISWAQRLTMTAWELDCFQGQRRQATEDPRGA